MNVKLKKKYPFPPVPFSASNVEWSFCVLHYQRLTCRSLLLAVFPIRTGVYILPLLVTAAKVGHSVYIATYM